MLEIDGEALGRGGWRGGVSLRVGYVMVGTGSEDLSMPRTGSKMFLDLGGAATCGRGIVGD